MNAKLIISQLESLANPEIASHSSRFFKTGKGEYGEGDKFRGIRVPVIRDQVRKYKETSPQEIQKLLKSSFHEDRLCALLLLVYRFKRGDEGEREAIYKLYLKNIPSINNWDLVDSSAHHIVGGYLWHKDKRILNNLVISDNLWERRIAVLATFFFIKEGLFNVSLRLAKRLLKDEEDLIHKAVGWMLREIGKRDLPVEEHFLIQHYQKMPRTMLRYAIEKFPERRRKQYLAGII